VNELLSNVILPSIYIIGLKRNAMMNWIAFSAKANNVGRICWLCVSAGYAQQGTPPMKKKDALRSATNEELIRRYEELAIVHGELRTAKEANRAYAEKTKVWSELHQRGSSAIGSFLQLLESRNPMIRLSVAADALSVAPERAEPVLEHLTREPRAVGFTALTASMTLKEWRAGRLKRVN
jgi:hypothetical protein